MLEQFKITMRMLESLILRAEADGELTDGELQELFEAFKATMRMVESLILRAEADGELTDGELQELMEAFQAHVEAIEYELASREEARQAAQQQGEDGPQIRVKI